MTVRHGAGQTHPVLVSLFAQLDEARLRWCLLRGESELSLPVGDVDLLVHPDDLHDCCRIIERNDFAHIASFGRGTHQFFLCYDRSSDQWIKLDIVTELSYGPAFTLRTGAAPGCLSRRVRVGDVYLLKADDAFWSLLLHCVLDKGGFSDRHVAALGRLLPDSTIEAPLAGLLGSVCPPEWSVGQILDAARRQDWGRLSKLAGPLSANWRRSLPGPSRRGVARARIWERLEKLRLWAYRRGLSVALLGPDGAGKSTLALGIQQSFFFPTRLVYMGLWQRGKPEAPGAGGAGEFVAWFTTVAGRPLKAWRGFLTAQYHQARGRLVVFDRYTYDARLPPRQPLTWRSRPYFWVLRHACPPPDLVLLLDVPGQVMYERKGEESVDRLEADRGYFRDLCRHLSNVKVLDGTRSRESLRAEAVECIWRAYRARWGTKEKPRRTVLTQRLPLRHRRSHTLT